jgi:hypothetical protein
MTSILEQMEVKPVRASKMGVKLNMPSKGGLSIEGKIIDRTDDEGFDRESIMEKIRKRGLSIPMMEQSDRIKVLAEALIDDTLERDKTREIPQQTTEEKKKSAQPKIKKLKRRLKLSKKIGKGTITLTSEGVKPKLKKMSLNKTSKRLSDIPAELQDFEEELMERMPEIEPPVKLRAPSYYRNNRQIFVNFINSFFEPYKATLEDESENLTCQSMKKRKAGKFSLLTHQEIVRDYLNLFTPYRGLLLYHGLGAGKTCASIAIAEGFQNPMKVVIMTPASLRQNYISELKVCGNALYRVNQHWEFLSNNGNAKKTRTLARMLSITEKIVRDNGGAWFVNIKKDANYESLSTQNKIVLNEQIDEMIRAKYQFINYNGLRNSHLDSLSDNGRINPFDNKVIIIDEAHNFVSRIVNKLKKPESLSMKLYEYLLSAENCRVVLLTGTPVINYPNELGILFNILRGYIKTYKFQLSVKAKGKVDENRIREIIGKFNAQDFLEYNAASFSLTITRNPFGFINKYGPNGQYEGMRMDRQGNIDKSKFIGIIKSRLESADIDVIRVTEQAPYKALPDTLDSFKALFIDPKTQNLRNNNLFKRRILGLTSYFRSAQEELMPSFDIEKDLIHEMIPMHDYQFGIYEEARAEERKTESKRPKFGLDGALQETTSTYRIFSRAYCNFVFPPEIPRPKPREGDKIGDVLERNAGEDILDIVSVEEELANVDGKYERDDEAKIVEKRKTNRDGEYEKRIKKAIVALRERSAEYLSPEGLDIYGRKFLKMYNNITSGENRGCHLVYSQFRTLEGVGVFAMVLEQNGFSRLVLKQDEDSIWRIVENPEDEGKPKYALYTGTESSEVKEMTRLIFNGDWEKLPDSIKTTLKERAPNNNYGEIVKVFMITSSGAEGISLRNCRFVHITEPYWHPVRMEQVIGRARRICSHEDLPIEDRNVKVFLYLMTFTKEQQVPKVADKGMASKGLLEKDVSKIDKTTPLTSDQALYEISNIKENINKQLLVAVKESAFDCALHSKSGDKESLMCVSFGTPPPASFTTKPALTIEKDFDKEEKRNMKKITWKAVVVTLSRPGIGKRKYAFKRDGPKSKTGEVYDLDSYKKARKSGGQAILVGRLGKDKKTGKPQFNPLM